MNISDLLTLITSLPNCSVLPASGSPVLGSDHTLPDDLAQFYSLCGGLELFQDATFSMQISSPQQLVLANPIIFRDFGLTESEIEATKPHESWSWYIIAKEESGLECITIDLSPERLGQCYDSFWDRHPDDREIVATSFTELVEKLVRGRGQLTASDLRNEA